MSNRPSVWRHASRSPVIFGIPAVGYLPMFIWLFHISWWTFYLAIGCIVVLGALRMVFNVTFTVLWHRIAHWVRGPHIKGRPWWYRKYSQGIKNGRLK